MQAQRFVLSSTQIPEQNRPARWREALQQLAPGLTGELVDREAPGFHAHVDARITGSLAAFRYRGSGALRISRGRREIAARSWEDRVLVFRERGQGAQLSHAGRELVARPGDLVIGDPTLPAANITKPGPGWEHWLLPRRLVESHLTSEQRPRWLHLPQESGVVPILQAYLDALSVQLDALNEVETGLVADNFCRLLAIACGSAAGDHRDAILAARLEQARRYIALHLADPDLSPDKVAAALRISLRQLHQVFAPSGSSFGQYVQRQRLEQCREALLNPGAATRSVTDIAFAWGFNSLPTFYRTFRRTFGAAPGDVRANARPRRTE